MNTETTTQTTQAQLETLWEKLIVMKSGFLAFNRVQLDNAKSQVEITALKQEYYDSLEMGFCT